MNQSLEPAAPEIPLEFSRPFGVTALAATGRVVDLEATPDERAALTERYGIVSLGLLTASVRVSPVGRTVRAEGTLTADVEQICGVTAVPFVARVEHAFERFYSTERVADAGKWDEDLQELELDPLADDPPDPIIDGRIDLGELVAEELALAIDPYPRIPGAEFVPPPDLAPPDDEPREGRQNPFAVLAGLKTKDNDKG